MVNTIHPRICSTYVEKNCCNVRQLEKNNLEFDVSVLKI